MPANLGRDVPIPLAQRVVSDLLYASRHVPAVPFAKVIDIHELVAARSAASPRPSWCSIFTKAFAKVVAEEPKMRRAYLSCPWERYFETSQTVADIVMEVDLHGEPALAVMPFQAPHELPLLEIDAHIAHHQQRPVPCCPPFRRSLRIARLPRILRRLAWWSALHCSGRLRSKYVGNFGVSSVGNWGVDSLRPIGPWTSLLHYGAIAADGVVAVRMTFDHRVLNGSHASQALNRLETFLTTDLLTEVRALQSSDTPACASESSCGRKVA